MKAIEYHGIQDVRFVNAPEPEMPADDEVLVRVAYAGICGSDLHIYNKGMFIEEVPQIMGHEFVGIVEASGSDAQAAEVAKVAGRDVQKAEVAEAADGAQDGSAEKSAVRFKPGDIVVGNPMVTCGSCEGCSAGLPNTCSSLAFIGEVCPGGFAQYIKMKAKDLIPVKERTDLKQAALIEPLAVALNLCERAELCEDDELAIIGAGPIGLLCVLAAKKLFNVKKAVVAGRSAFRMELAGKLGADFVSDRLPEGEKYSKVVETAGKKPTVDMALSSCAPNGSIYVVSVFEDSFELDLNLIVGAQLRLVGCNAYEKRHLHQAAELLAEGAIDVSPLITGVFPPERAKEAFELLNEKEKKHAKILFDMK